MSSSAALHASTLVPSPWAAIYVMAAVSVPHLSPPPRLNVLDPDALRVLNLDAPPESEMRHMLSSSLPTSSIYAKHTSSRMCSEHTRGLLLATYQAAWLDVVAWLSV